MNLPWIWKLPDSARWGDMAVFDEDEMHEILKKPVVKEAPTLVDLKLTAPKPHNPLKCTSCQFRKHSCPPADFTQVQRDHCCGFCEKTGGKRHGERCERAKV